MLYVIVRATKVSATQQQQQQSKRKLIALLDKEDAIVESDSASQTCLLPVPKGLEGDS